MYLYINKIKFNLWLKKYRGHFLIQLLKDKWCQKFSCCYSHPTGNNLTQENIKMTRKGTRRDPNTRSKKKSHNIIYALTFQKSYKAKKTDFSESPKNTLWLLLLPPSCLNIYLLVYVHVMCMCVCLRVRAHASTHAPAHLWRSGDWLPVGVGSLLHQVGHTDQHQAQPQHLYLLSQQPILTSFFSPESLATA